jgi:hypothetical protein
MSPEALFSSPQPGSYLPEHEFFGPRRHFLGLRLTSDPGEGRGNGRDAFRDVERTVLSSPMNAASNGFPNDRPSSPTG